MSGDLIVEIIKVGAVTVMGKAITKAVGEKEISEIIAGVGYTVVGVDILCLLAPIVKGIQGVCTKINLTVDKIGHIVNTIQSIPGLSWLLKTGTKGVTGDW